MKKFLAVLMMTFSFSQAAFALEVIDVGACVQDELQHTAQGGWLDLGSGSYYTYRLLVTYCHEFTFGPGEKVARNMDFDLSWYEDNDVSGITDNLKSRCEAERAKLLAEKVEKSSTGCK